MNKKKKLFFWSIKNLLSINSVFSETDSNELKSLANLAVDVRDWLNRMEEGQQVGRRLSQLDKQKVVDVQINYI